MRQYSTISNTANSRYRIIDLPKIVDERGNLSFIEAGKPVPFLFKRVYWIYDVPGGECRGGHAYKNNREFFVALSGSFDVVFQVDGKTEVVTLNRPYRGLYLPNVIWRRLENFSTNAVAMILASENYSEQDYIRDYKEYLIAVDGNYEHNR